MARKNIKEDIGTSYNGKFASKLREIMEKGIDGKGGFTQEEIAEVMGVRRQAVSQYCNGVTVPTIDKLEKLADYLGVPTDYLLGRTKAKSTDYDVQYIIDKTGLDEVLVNNLVCSQSGSSDFVLSNLKRKRESFNKIEMEYPGIVEYDVDGNAVKLKNPFYYFREKGFDDKDIESRVFDLCFKYPDLDDYQDELELLNEIKREIDTSGIKVSDFVNRFAPDIHALGSYAKLNNFLMIYSEPGAPRRNITLLNTPFEMLDIVTMFEIQITKYFSMKLDSLKHYYFDDYWYKEAEVGDPDGNDQKEE